MYGTSYGYRAAHKWVERRLGKPEGCSHCGTKEPRKYQWANLSGEYKKDLSDWIRLCIPCHTKYFTPRSPVCGKGHPMQRENIGQNYLGHRFCLTCKRDHARNYQRRRRQKIRMGLIQ